MEHEANLRRLIAALNYAIEVSKQIVEGVDTNKVPQDMMAELIARLAKDKEIGPLREWIQELEKKVIIILTQKEGVRSRELSGILGTSVAATRQYMMRIGLTFNAQSEKED